MPTERKRQPHGLALLGSKRELQVAWGLITFLSSLISCLLSLSAIVPLSYTQLSTWVVPVSIFLIHMPSLIPHVLHMNVAVAVVLRVKARLSASTLFDWLLPRSNLYINKLSSLFCWWYMLLCVYFKVWYLVSVSAKLLAICLPQRSNSSNQTCCIWNISFVNLRNFAQFVGGFCVYSGVLWKMHEKQRAGGVLNNQCSWVWSWLWRRACQQWQRFGSLSFV